MFKDSYEKRIDSIKADGYIKEKVLNKISVKKTKKKSSRSVAFRTAAALVATFAVAFSVIVIRDNDRTAKTPVAGEKKTYEDIYKTVEVFIPKTNPIDEFIETIAGGTAKKYSNNAETYEYVEEYANGTDVMDDGALNGSAKPAAGVETEAVATDENAVDHSETTTQVEGVDEADIIKTNGKFIYSYSTSKRKLRVISAGKEPKLLQTVDIVACGDMYLAADKLVLIGDETDNVKKNYLSDRITGNTIAYIYSIAKDGTLTKEFECSQSGFYNTSRVIGDKLYLISNYSLSVRNIDSKKPETYIPSVKSENFDDTVSADDVYINNNCSSATYTVICGFDIKTGELVGSQSLLGGTYTLYCSTKNIITAEYEMNAKTNIARFSIANGKVELAAEGVIDGSLLNQFSIDEHNGYFRFVTTVNSGTEIREGNLVRYEMKNYNSVAVLDKELKRVGGIDNIAPDERVYSVRFMGDTAYFVTFRQVDPLFSVDLSDPQNPKIIGALKIPGFSNYLYPFGAGRLLGVGQDADEKTGRTGNVKLSMFDISNPANVSEASKLVLDAEYSPALNSHKETLIDVNKNLISFSVWGKNGSEYRIFGFSDGEFKLKAQIKLGTVYDSTRGFYIGNEFYIITENKLFVYNMADYERITEINLS